MVKRNLAKVETAGSSPVVRSKVPIDYRPLWWVSQAVRQRPAKPYRRVRLSYPPLILFFAEWYDPGGWRSGSALP